MKRLSGLDATFLNLETPSMPMHVGALHLFELPAGFRGRFAVRLRRHIAERLPIAPALRRRPWTMPMNVTNPVWVDAEPDLVRHVVELRLPACRGRAAPGAEMAALEALVAKLHVELLDRRLPLWKFHVIEGLAKGANGRRRVALYTQLHHAAVDGKAAVALANALMDIGPEPRRIELKPSTRPRQLRLSLAEMISGAVAGEVAQLTRAIRGVPAAVGSIAAAAAQIAARSEIVSGRRRAGALGLAPRTVLNLPATATRAYATLSLPLAECKALGRRHGATLNDVVLWLVSTALRGHFLARGDLPRASMVAAVPVSLRAQGDTASDNQASMTLVSLGTHVADPLDRLAHVQSATRSMKRTLAEVKSVLPTDFPSLGVSWLEAAAAALYRRATQWARVPAIANVVVSNVPGPTVPLYMAGAKMLANYPCSIVADGLTFNVTVQSYDQSLDFGLMADGQALPDVRGFARELDRAMAVLRTLPAAGSEAAEALRRSTRRDSAPRVAKAAARARH